MVKVIFFSYQTIIIEGTSLAPKYNRIGVIVLIRLYSHLLVIIIITTPSRSTTVGALIG